MGQEGAEELGRGLARLHAAGAPCFGDPRRGGDPQRGGNAQRGGDARRGGKAQAGGDALRIGPLELPNEPAEEWASFYAERRIGPLARQAAKRGLLSDAAARALDRLCERMGELAGPPEPPARLHGDLWSGNVMADAEGRPWLIDPAAYGGHREVDLAMLRLFGAPSERLFAAYEETAPLAEGWRERVELYQLLPLLVHALLFGGSYCASVERVARRYA
jgi:fructosamine-3-kinase